MAATPANLIPTPLTGTEFLKSSHFKIGYEPRLHEKCIKTSNSCFSAHWGLHSPCPFWPVPSKRLFHQDLDKIREIQSEMQMAFPAYNVTNFATTNKSQMQISNLKMHADPRIRVFQTTCQEKFTYPGSEHFNTFTKESLRKFETDSFPEGDRDKLRIPPTQNQYAFRAQPQTAPVRAPCLHLGGPSPLKWEMEPFPVTTYQNTFQGKSSSPSDMYEKVTSHMALGDPRLDLGKHFSEQKNAYTLLDLPERRYNKNNAAANVFCVNIRLGDDRFYGCPRDYKDMPFPDTPECIFRGKARPDSLIMPGDTDPGRGTERNTYTTTHRSYTPIEIAKVTKATAKPSCVIFGEEKRAPSFMNSVYQKCFKSPRTPRVPKVDSCLMKSHIKMGSDAMHFMTSSIPKMGPYSVKKHPVSEEIKQRVKYSHILPPEASHEFSTEYKDNYPYKYIGPLVLPDGNQGQESHVPIGIHGKRWSGKQVVIPC
ncbi:testis-expressed protein 45 isoform X1 [Monodelphis domestica]|uniref:testis-expressed protein 45 isoform X1 n=2 Tax=Monodelphis domestica TaxID=13616 RepID=UPI0024E1AC10|nr:testis-expressed protein 45 isoform X1 [Monodelphis domestica]XP_007489627.2 testis-expressed protein 45 isoform X1 [Monodelphis domestica]